VLLQPALPEAPETLLEMVGLAEDGNLLASQFSKGMKIRSIATDVFVRRLNAAKVK
jgi:ABC-type multidrug transport system ATPase subunit